MDFLTLVTLVVLAFVLWQVRRPPVIVVYPKEESKEAPEETEKDDWWKHPKNEET